MFSWCLVHSAAHSSRRRRGRPRTKQQAGKARKVVNVKKKPAAVAPVSAEHMGLTGNLTNYVYMYVHVQAREKARQMVLIRVYELRVHGHRLISRHATIV